MSGEDQSTNPATEQVPLAPEYWGDLEDGRLSALVAIARAAGDHTLRYFGTCDLEVDAKSDDSPVTIADREAEKLARQRIQDDFAQDTVQGEEFAEQSGTSVYRWVIDPIDGTKSFICGVPLYSTLLALEKDGQPIAGAIYIPALNEIIVAASGRGCWHQTNPAGGQKATWTRARVSQRGNIREAVFVTSQVDTFEQRGAGVSLQVA